MRLLVLVVLAGTTLAALAVAWREARFADWERVERWAPEIQAAAAESGLDPCLLAGLVYAESRGRADALSRSGAEGLCQVKPATAREVARRLRIDGEPPYAAADNLRIGARYLREQVDAWQDQDLGLFCYRLGPGHVARAVEAAGGAAAFLESRAAGEGPWAWRDQILAAAAEFRARGRLEPR